VSYQQRKGLGFEKVVGYKKRISCSRCGRIVLVSNLNRKICNDCGSRAEVKQTVFPAVKSGSWVSRSCVRRVRGRA
jgi:rRNA maturation endonuclease Nob1